MFIIQTFNWSHIQMKRMWSEFACLGSAYDKDMKTCDFASKFNWLLKLNYYSQIIFVHYFSSSVPNSEMLPVFHSASPLQMDLMCYNITFKMILLTSAYNSFFVQLHLFVWNVQSDEYQEAVEFYSLLLWHSLEFKKYVSEVFIKPPNATED